MRCSVIILCFCFKVLSQNPADLLATTQILYPTQVFGLLLWCSSDYGCYSDAGSTLCADGSSVQRWLDRSGNGNDLGQVAAKKPLYRTGVLNGFPILQFSGGTYKCLTNTLPSSNAIPLTYFVVAYPSNNYNSGILVDDTVVSGSKATWWTSSGTTYDLSMDGITGVSPHWILVPGYRQKGIWYQITTEFNGLKSSIYVSSKRKAFGDTGTAGARGVKVGASVSESNGFMGNLAEIIIFSGRVLSNSERYGVEMYLKQKYNLPDAF